MRQGESLHHRRKQSHLPKNRRWSPELVVHVCGRLGTMYCHGWCEENPLAAESIGFHVRPWQEPAAIPIKLHRSEWFLLLEDGSYASWSPGEAQE
jgi:hypothetical protein